MADIELLELENTTITDTTSSESINVINSDNVILEGKIGQCAVGVGLSGGSVIAFDQFDIQGLFTTGGTWVTLRSAFVANASDEFIPIVTAILNTLAHGANAAFIVNTKGLFAIRFRSAQAGVTASPVTRLIEICGRSEAS